MTNFHPRTHSSFKLSCRPWTLKSVLSIVGAGVLVLVCPGSTAYRFDDISIGDASGVLYLFPINGGGNFSYNTRILDFFNPIESLLPPDAIVSSNLMVPPTNYSHLCTYPPSLLIENSTAGVYDDADSRIGDGHDESSPITLLVSMGGGCDVVTKINVVLQIKRTLTSIKIFSIIFYNDHRDGQLMDSEDPPFLPTDFSTSDIFEGLETMVFGTIGSASGTSILMRITTEVGLSTASPELAIRSSSSSNGGWKLPVSLKRNSVDGYNETGPENLDRNTTDESEGVGGVVLFKYFFISFIALAGCLIVLRSNDDIRFEWRRNENGRIIGYDFVSIANNHDPSIVRRVRDNLLSTKPQDLMTAEAVMALPEIEYRSCAVLILALPVGNTSTKLIDADPELQLQRQRSVRSIILGSTLWGGCRTCNSSSIRDASLTMDVPTGSADDDGIVCGTTHLTPIANDQPITTTISTGCSICLEEFEDGELVRVMPRCRHSFHTDCIMPWLTERQGTCPFCKTKIVVEIDNGRSSSDNKVAPTIENDSEGDTAAEESSHGDARTPEECNSDDEMTPSEDTHSDDETSSGESNSDVETIPQEETARVDDINFEDPHQEMRTT
jgi:hypothetical protein